MTDFRFSASKAQTYQATNPRPADFDKYWDKALAEMHALDPKVELVPAAFQVPGVECFDLYFTGVGGARVHAKFLRPEVIDSPRPAVLMFHGYSCDSNDWSYKLGFVAQSFIVAALDSRGQGGTSEEVGGVIGNTLHGHIIRGLEDALAGRPEKLLYADFLDTASWSYRQECPKRIEERLGHRLSQGGGSPCLSG